MGMNHFGEIELLSSIAKPDICIITNIGTSHIGNLGSRENILKAKLEILKGCKDPVVVINNDNDLLNKWYEENKESIKIITYGIKNKSDFNAKNIKLETNRSIYDCKIDGKDINITVPVGGEHFVLNSLCATAVGKTLDIEIQDIVNGIESFELTKNRMDITEIKSEIKVINDAYNASFESMKASLTVLAGFKENRKIAVLGDMFELGKFSKHLHEKVGIEVYKNNIDILICSGENSKYIVKQAEKEGMEKDKIFYLENKDEIIELLNKIKRPKDIILWKASNGMKFYDLATKFIEQNQ